MPTWIQDIDDQVFQWFQNHQEGLASKNLENLTALGSTTLLALLVVFAAGLLLLNRRIFRALLLVVLVVGLYAATDVIKNEVARPRPVLKRQAHSPSFPSSHSSLSMGILLMLALCLRGAPREGRQPCAYRYVLLWAFGVSLVVGVSRLYLGKHFLSDVVAGWLLGLGFALLFFLGERLVEGGRPAAKIIEPSRLP